MSQKAISKLLQEAMKAHVVYERNELHGVYDEQWPHWYADYVIVHGAKFATGATGHRGGSEPVSG